MTMSQSRKPIVCHGHSRPIVEINYSNITPDGYFLASASKDKTPMLRHGDTGDWYGTFTGHKGAVWSCVLNQSALLCATASADFTARIWNACLGTQLYEFAHVHIVRTTAFSTYDNLLATAGHDKTIRLFDLGAPDAEPRTLPLTASAVRDVMWLQDDKVLVCTLLDTPGINVYDMRSLQLVQTIQTSAPVTSLDLTYDKQFLTTAEGQSVRFFDASNLNLLKEQKLTHDAEAASYCPSQKRFVAGGSDMWVHLYDYQTGQELEVNKGHHGPVHTLRFAPTYDAYASGSEDGTIRIWSLDAAAAAENGPEGKALVGTPSSAK